MMMKLKKVTVNKYKSIQQPQVISIDPSITTIVGMNEAGKTSLLTAIAKTNYFVTDEDYKFDTIQDYPRNELIDFQESGEDCNIVTCEYEISEEMLSEISEAIGEGVLDLSLFSQTHTYKGGVSISAIGANEKKFIEHKIKKFVLSKETKKEILGSSISNIPTIVAKEGDSGLVDLQTELKTILAESAKNTNWKPLDYHVYLKWIKPRIPKFWYFDDYYPLKGKININELQRSTKSSETDKTAKALFELAKISPAEIISASDKDYEKFVAQLEASSNKISKEIFKYWSTNTNLKIEVKIQEVTNPNNQREKVLDIRVENRLHGITLPLDRRSKGFNWFFSFIVWFSKIQADKTSDYILLLDEPGLNLHASAQADLLRFFEELSKKYQIIYTTHSPFMVESTHLDRVRTCLETTDRGTVISDSIQEKDPNTLFPLQAALGYDIAQNLFISKNNLLVEGPADLIYLTVMSNILQTEKRTFLKESITIVPVGGLDKVTTFISLLRGSKLNVACLLDTFTDQKGKQRVADLIQNKIIKDKHIRFFNEFSNNGKEVADFEDLFTKDEYLKIFNESFSGEHAVVDVSHLDNTLDTIIKQINKAIGKERFNHYRPANRLNQMGVDKNYFSKETLDRFEKMFDEVNRLFP